MSVDYGPLTFSLKIGEQYVRHDSSKTAIGDSDWQKGADPKKWPAFEILPTTPWNYGLVLDERDPARSFTIQRGNWPANDFPFTVETAPLTLTAKAKRIPEWELDRFGLCSVLQDSPVLSEQPLETVSLIPMGAARLRISAFPVIGDGPNAHRWTAPRKPKPSPYKITASHSFSGDSLNALADGWNRPLPTITASHVSPGGITAAPLSGFNTNCLMSSRFHPLKSIGSTILAGASVAFQNPGDCFIAMARNGSRCRMRRSPQ